MSDSTLDEGKQTTEDGSEVRRQMRLFVHENFLYLRPNAELADDDKLLELGVIDSLGFIELVEEVQSRFGIAVEDVEITEENFGSIAAIDAFVERKGRS